MMLTINFSSRTTSMDLQRNLEASVEKRTKEIYGPPMGKRLLVFMDDLNMPRVGTCLLFSSSPSPSLPSLNLHPLHVCLC
jgi:hypothetical protein